MRAHVSILTVCVDVSELELGGKNDTTTASM